MNFVCKRNQLVFTAMMKYLRRNYFTTLNTPFPLFLETFVVYHPFGPTDWSAFCGRQKQSQNFRTVPFVLFL